MMAIMMLFTMIDLAQMVDNARPNGISKNIDGCAESERRYYFRNQSIYFYIYSTKINHYNDVLMMAMYMNTLLTCPGASQPRG